MPPPPPKKNTPKKKDSKANENGKKKEIRCWDPISTHISNLEFGTILTNGGFLNLVYIKLYFILLLYHAATATTVSIYTTFVWFTSRCRCPGIPAHG